MSEQRSSQNSRKGARRASVHDLGAHEARAVLVSLWKRGGSLREAIRQEIEHYLTEVDSDSVAAAVQKELEALAVEDIWARSGPSRYGYTDPAEETGVMIEEVVEPFVEEMERYQKLGMQEEAFSCCLGILEGIYAYGTESESDFKDWAPDDPREAFGWVRRKWQEGCKDQRAHDHMESELVERCPAWA